MSQLRVYLIGICVGACLSSMVYHHLQTEWRDQQLRTMVEGVFQINDAMKGRGLALTVQDTIPQCYCAKVNQMRSSSEFKAYMEDLYASEPPCLDNPDHPSCHYQPPEPLSCLLCSPHWDAPLPRTVNSVAVTRSPNPLTVDQAMWVVETYAERYPGAMVAWESAGYYTVRDSARVVVDTLAHGFPIVPWRRVAHPWYTPEMGLVYPPDSLAGDY